MVSSTILMGVPRFPNAKALRCLCNSLCVLCMERVKQQMLEWDSLRIGLILCYEGEVRAIGRGMQKALAATAWLVERGWARVTDDDGRRVRARAGEWLMVRPGIRLQEFSADMRLLSINFRAAFHTGEDLFSNGLSLVIQSKDHPQLEKCARKLLKTAYLELGKTQSFWAMTAPTSLSGYLMVHRELTDWVMVWSEALMNSGISPNTVYSNDPRVKQALAFLQGHIRNPELDGERIAAEVGLSLSQLNRQFLRERGETLRRCHQRHRLEFAQHMLMRSALSI